MKLHEAAAGGEGRSRGAGLIGSQEAATGSDSADAGPNSQQLGSRVLAGPLPSSTESHRLHLTTETTRRPDAKRSGRSGTMAVDELPRGDGPEAPSGDSARPPGGPRAGHPPSGQPAGRSGGMVAEVAVRYGPLECAPRGADAPDVAEQVAWLPSGRGVGRGPAATARFETPPQVDWSIDGSSQTLRVRSAVAPPRDDATYYRVCCQLRRHLRDARKPLIIVAAESAESERFQQAITAFGGSPALQEAANLVLVLTGPPQAEAEEDRQTRVKQLLLAIDRHDLYGLVALYVPQDDLEITELLRIGRDRRGVLLGADTSTVDSESSPLELLASHLEVPVIVADSGDLPDLCGPVLIDPESWAELSRESRPEAAPSLAPGHLPEPSSLGRRLLETHRRRGWRVPAGRLSVVAGSRAAAAG